MKSTPLTLGRDSVLMMCPASQGVNFQCREKYKRLAEYFEYRNQLQLWTDMPHVQSDLGVKVLE